MKSSPNRTASSYLFDCFVYKLWSRQWFSLRYSDFNVGRVLQTMVIKRLLFWEARNVNKGESLRLTCYSLMKTYVPSVSFEYLFVFLDAHPIAWHSCSCLCLFTRHFPKVHNCPLSEYGQTSPEKYFDVTRSNNLFKVTIHLWLFDSPTSLSLFNWRWDHLQHWLSY